MELLLTILSVVALWALLTLLVIALLLILKTLESIRGYLEKIAMGVRAIEIETAPLGTHANTVGASLTGTVSALSSVASGLSQIEQDLDPALAGLAKTR
jgi:uncharacterized protein YoxC